MPDFTPEEFARIFGTQESWNLMADSASGSKQTAPQISAQGTAKNAPVSTTSQTSTTGNQGFTPGTTVVDLAEVGLFGRRGLRERGFSYQDPTTGEIVTKAGGDLTASQMRELTRNARRQERIARRYGLGNTAGWSQDAIALRQQQVNNDSRYTTLASPKPTQRIYNYDFGSTFYDGDKKGYADITTGILKALYDNGKFDILDSMKGIDGKIGLEGLQKYHSGLGVEGINSGYFDEASINAMLSSGALTQAQADRFLTSARALAPKPAAPTTGAKGFGSWTAEAIKNASVDDLAAAVWRGELGNGLDRKNALGDRYGEVQARVGTISHKQGGRLMKYFQQGGSVAAQQVAQEQAQEQQAQLNEMFMALAKNPKETLMALQKQGVQPKQVIELAQKMADKNPAAKEALAAISQMSQMAKQGAKLTYIKRLRGECPEGYEPKLYRAGGKVCTKCEKIQADKCGGKAKKHEDGGEAELVTEFKNRKKK